MSNTIDADGIHTETLSEIITALEEAFKSIYGTDIIVTSNSPDGQIINNFALMKKDILDLIVHDYNSKDPDQAVGTALDGVSALCGITRQGATYTETEVVVTTDRTLNLNGLDATTSTPFTVSDDQGNEFQLITSASLSLGANTLNFRSSEVGYIQVIPNTITTPVSIVLGIVSVNNPSSPYQTGQNEETDAQFRLRRQRSVAKPSQGFLGSLYGNLLNVDGVSDCLILENTSDSIDGDSIPGHSIWVIVDGGSDEDVANSIYAYRNAGCGMKGSEAVDVTQIDGSTFEVNFDRAVEETLHIQFTLSAISGGTIDEDAIKAYLIENYILGVYEIADITSITALIKIINPDAIVSNAGVGNDGVYYSDSIYPTSKQNKFVFDEDTIHITI